MKHVCLIALMLAAVLSCVDRTETPVREVPVPLIDSVSQGVFTDCIRIDWHADTTDIARFEIYRSLSESGQYDLIAVVNASPSTNTYFDSVKNSAVYYYKIAAVDSKSRSGAMSSSGYGYIRSLPVSPVLRIEEYADFVALFWSPSKDAKEYTVYRSSEGCSTGMTRISRTSLTAFFDSATFPGIAYYTVGVLDDKGHDVAVSNCSWGGLSGLPAPGGCAISGGATTHTVFLTWDSVPGAHEYVIYRSVSYCPKAKDEYVRTKSRSYADSINNPGYVYYAVAAVDNSERTSPMGTCLRGSVGLLSPPQNVNASYDSVPGVVALSWKALAGAGRYIIYRSTFSCSFKMGKIDSAAVSLEYRDSTPTSEPYSYVVAGVDSQGIEGLPSACVEGRVKLLPAPGHLNASRGPYAGKVLVSWDSVSGADGYIYYRGVSNVLEKAVPMDTVTSLYDFDTVGTMSLYYYWVAARDRLGPGKRSDYIWGRALAEPQLTLASYDDSSMTLAWETDTAALAWKYLYRFSIEDDDYRMFDSTTGSKYMDKPNDYSFKSYRLLIKTAVGDSLFSNIAYGSKLVPAPRGLKATGTAEGVLLEWNSLPGISTYYIFRADSASDSTVFFAEANDTSFFDEEASFSRYRYRVAADNGVLEGKLSDPVIGGAVRPTGMQSKVPKR